MAIIENQWQSTAIIVIKKFNVFSLVAIQRVLRMYENFLSLFIHFRHKPRQQTPNNCGILEKFRITFHLDVCLIIFSFWQSVVIAER
jgi:hypothetical protein